jgi:hypothetical protein
MQEHVKVNSTSVSASEVMLLARRQILMKLPNKLSMGAGSDHKFIYSHSNSLIIIQGQ